MEKECEESAEPLLYGDDGPSMSSSTFNGTRRWMKERWASVVIIVLLLYISVGINTVYLQRNSLQDTPYSKRPCEEPELTLTLF